ncbi:MAG: hypothetical protein EBU49_15480, partial [Proteobacteria bacterium]|nr:hypothetical protein [Pseudomonadota bacterium]
PDPSLNAPANVEQDVSQADPFFACMARISSEIVISTPTELIAENILGDFCGAGELASGVAENAAGATAEMIKNNIQSAPRTALFILFFVSAFNI